VTTFDVSRDFSARALDLVEITNPALKPVDALAKLFDFSAKASTPGALGARLLHGARGLRAQELLLAIEVGKVVPVPLLVQVYVSTHTSSPVASPLPR
jgi:hypothetical protein